MEKYNKKMDTYEETKECELETIFNFHINIHIDDQSIIIPLILSNNYNILSKSFISGSFGDIYLAKYNNEKIVVKRIHNNTKNKQISLKNEIKILEKIIQIPHINIVKFFGINQKLSYTDILMEYCKGGDLMDYVVNNEFIDKNTCFIIIKQVLLAVHHLHKHSIIHRDIKLENILLYPNIYHICLCDFGLACYKPYPQKCITKCGTTSTAAPEVFTANINTDNYYDQRCDIWSIGIIMYCIRCGIYPFSDSNLSIQVDLICSGKYNYPPNINVDNYTKIIIKQILTVNPDNRISISNLLKLID